MRTLLVILALGLSWHYATLAAHLACDVHPNCHEKEGEVFGAASTAGHEHCLVQISVSRPYDSSIKDGVVAKSASFVQMLPLPESPRIFEAPEVRHLKRERSSASLQFTRTVRIIS